MAEKLTYVIQVQDDGSKKVDAFAKTLMSLEKVAKQVSQALRFDISATGLENISGEIKYIGESMHKVNDDVKEGFDLWGKLGDIIEGAVNLAVKALKKLGEITKEILSDAIRAYSQFEDKMINVRRVTGMTEEEMDDLGHALMNLSVELGAIDSTTLAEVAETASILGLRGKENVLEFAEAIVKIATVTDIAANEAAAKIPAILTVYGIATDEMGAKTKEFGNIISVLGDNLNATQSQILQVAAGLAGTAASAGLSQEQMLALSAALASVEKKFGRAATNMAQILNQLGLKYEEWADLLKINSAELKYALETNPVKALQMVFEAMQKLEETEGILARNEVLAEMGIRGTRTNEIFKKMILATGELDKALALAGEEKEKQTALDEKFGISMQKLSLQWTSFNNILDNILKLLGEPLVKALSELFELDINPLLKSFYEWLKTSEFLNKIWPSLINTIKIGIIGIIAGFEKWLDEVGGWQGAWEWMAETAKSFFDWLKQGLPAVLRDFGTFRAEIEKIPEYWFQIKQAVIDTKRAIEDFFQTMRFWGEEIGNDLDKIVGIFGKIKTFITGPELDFTKNIDGMAEALKNTEEATKKLKNATQDFGDMAVYNSVYPDINEAINTTVDSAGALNKELEKSTTTLNSMSQEVAASASAMNDIFQVIGSASSFKDLQALESLAATISSAAMLSSITQAQQRVVAAQQAAQNEEWFGVRGDLSRALGVNAPPPKATFTPPEQRQRGTTGIGFGGGAGIVINIPEGSVIDDSSVNRWAAKIGAVLQEQQGRIIRTGGFGA